MKTIKATTLAIEGRTLCVMLQDTGLGAFGPFQVRVVDTLGELDCTQFRSGFDALRWHNRIVEEHVSDGWKQH